jgi:carbon-monoxide dehydrogenase medium subunit
VIPPSFDYVRATSIDEALARLKSARGAAKLVAGGHSLIPLMKLRLASPTLLVDIARIAELSGIRERDGKIEIGAATVHREVAGSALVRERCPAVADAAAEIGDPQVRNRGTIGGSLAHGDPSADYPAAMLAVDAEILLVGPKGPRTVRAAGFFTGFFTVDLGADEIITGVRIAPAPASGYAKLHQRASHYAIVGVGAALEVAGGTVRAARVGITGAGPSATRLHAVEAALEGQALTAATVEKAAAGAGADLEDVAADLHASEAYRRAMIPVFAKRALERARARA